MSFTSFGQTIPVTGPNVGFPGTISRQGERVVSARQHLSTSPANLSFGEAAVIVPDATGGTFQSAAAFLAAAVANVATVAAQFAGIAIREVQTMLTYPAGQTPGLQQVGYYAAGAMAEVLERGSIVVPIKAGTPQSQGAVYLRIVANTSIAGTAVGDLEAAADTVATTGTASAASTALTVASGTGIKVGQMVTGLGIAAGTYVAAVSGTAVTLSQNTTAALSTTAVTFANTVALPHTVFRTGNLDANNNAEITIKQRVAA